MNWIAWAVLGMGAVCLAVSVGSTDRTQRLTVSGAVLEAAVVCACIGLMFWAASW